jgi:glycosyltransferase involved in cell wall biosynthesis
MHILVITGEYPPMQGGVGDYTRELARAFVDLGHKTSVLVSRALADAYAEQNSPDWRVLPLVDAWGWRCWDQIYRAVERIRPDVINVQYQAAAYDMHVPAINLLPWRWRRLDWVPPIVVTFHDLKPPYLFPKAGPLRDAMVRVLAHHSSAVIVTNAQDQATARRWPFFAASSARTRQPRLHQIPIGSNITVSPPADYRRADWRANQGYRPQDVVWAYFGFLNESKGGETLIRALAASRPPAHLLMIGGRVGSSDPTNRVYADRIQSLIDELGLSQRVRWTGYVTNQQVSAALLSADAVVLPYRDGISFRRGSLHAALAHGCPIVSTNPSVLLPELVEGENILLVPPDDPQAICQAVRRLHDDPELARRLGQGAATLARQFTWTHIARRTVDEAFAPLVSSQSALTGD